MTVVGSVVLAGVLAGVCGNFLAGVCCTTAKPRGFSSSSSDEDEHEGPAVGSLPRPRSNNASWNTVRSKG